MSDYKAETERLIKFAEGNGSVSAATAAVATATLALAEQQRIANIIALAHIDQDEAAHVALWEMADDGFMAHYVLRDNIAEGLGI